MNTKPSSPASPAPDTADSKQQPTTEPDREVLTWEAYGVAVRQLANQVADSGFAPDLILAIARGGLFPAGSLGYALSVKNLYVMNLEFYSGINKRLEMPVMLPPYLDKVDLTDARILVVDDVADTGHTLKAVYEFCQGVVSESRTAVLYQKPHTLVTCDYVWKHTDRWISFPWSSEEPLMLGQDGVVLPEA